LSLQKRTDGERFGRSLPDKFVAAYIILQFALMLNVSTFTNTLRHGVFYTAIDIFLPYYVASRALKNLAGFRDALTAFVVAALVLSATAAFEFVRHWLLYGSLGNALGVDWKMGKYLQRGDVLRVSGSTGHPIVLGYVMAVAIWFMLYLRKSISNTPAWVLGLTALMVGLVVPVSRGPWMGAAVMLVVFIATGPAPAKGFAKLFLLGLIALPILLISPAGQDIVNYLPFVGKVNEDTVAYRQLLVQIATQVILQNPLFGAYDYIYSAAFQELKQGEGIIDIVNTYVGIGLGSGLVGLFLFTGFFITVAAGIFKTMRSLPDRDDETYLLGRVLFTVLLGIMVTIATVSSIEVIPVIYWSVAGLGVAYMRMLAPVKNPGARTSAGFQPVPITGQVYGAAPIRQLNAQ